MSNILLLINILLTSCTPQLHSPSPPYPYKHQAHIPQHSRLWIHSAGEIAILKDALNDTELHDTELQETYSFSLTCLSTSSMTLAQNPGSLASSRATTSRRAQGTKYPPDSASVMAGDVPA